MLTSLPQKLGYIFLFGIAFAVMIAGVGAGVWLLCRMAGALRDLGRPPAERKRRREERRHPFRGASLRAKAAWLICCLEQALAAGGLDAEQGEPGCWYPLLSLLWQVGQWPPELVSTQWLDQVGELLPSALLTPAPDPAAPAPEEQRRFAAVYPLYQAAGPRMAYLGPLIQLVYQLVRDYWDDPAASPDDSLALLDRAGELLEEYNIPLPPKDAVEFLASQRSPGPGEPFVGRQCSSIVRW